MNKIIIVIMTIVLVSCNSNKLNQNYDKSSKNSDLNEIEKKLSKEEFIILKNYIDVKEKVANNLSEKTYRIIIQDAIDANYEEEAKKEEELKLENERIDKENLSKILCNKKWKKVDHAFQIKIPDNSAKNIEIAKEILTKTMSMVKDIKLSFKVIEAKEGFFVKAIFDTKTNNFFSGNGQQFKKYLANGTYIDYAGKDSISGGTWSFNSMNSIREIRPVESLSIRKKKEVYTIEILELDEKIYSFYEQEVSGYSRETITSTAITMKL